MTREEVLQSISLKKKFAKDMCLPITVFDNPYFLQRLKIIDPLHHCVEQFDHFCAELEALEDEHSFFEYYKDVKEDIIQEIRGNEAFNEFNTRPFPKVDSYEKRNLYAETNDNKLFISIDLKQANFSVMHLFDERIFDRKPTWEKYLSAFTDSAHIKQSKYIRQVILGACNPGHQIKAQRYYMGLLAADIAAKLPNVNIYSVNVDEILIEVDDRADFSWPQLLEIVNASFLGSCVKVQLFWLRKFAGIDGYWKYHVQSCWRGVETVGGFSIKGVNGELYHQVVKHFFKLLITEDDLVFYHNGMLARFMKPIEDPWRFEDEQGDPY